MNLNDLVTMYAIIEVENMATYTLLVFDKNEGRMIAY